MKILYTSYDPSLKNILQDKLTKLNKEGYVCTKFSYLSILQKKENPTYSHVAIFAPKEKYKRLKQIERGEWVNNLRDSGYEYVGNTGCLFVFNSSSPKAIVQDTENIEEFFKVNRFFTLIMKFVFSLFTISFLASDLLSFDSLLSYSNNSRIFSTILPTFVILLFGMNALFCLTSTTSYVRKKELKPSLTTIYITKTLLTVSTIVCGLSFLIDVVEYNLTYTTPLPIVTLADLGYEVDEDSSSYHQASSFLLNDSYQSLQLTPSFDYSDETFSGDLLTIQYYQGYNETLVSTYFTKTVNTLLSNDVYVMEQYDETIHYCTNSEGIVDLVIIYSDTCYIEIASTFDLLEHIETIQSIYS